MTRVPSDWPADAVVIKCPRGHPVTYWSQFVVGGPRRFGPKAPGSPARLEWFVRLSPRWVRDGDGWRKGKHFRRWWLLRMPEGRQQEELPDEAIRAEDGIHLPPPVRLTCPRPTCRDRFTVDVL